MWVFDTRTKNKRPLVHTFVTTFGLGEGKHNSIVHQGNRLYNYMGMLKKSVIFAVSKM